MKKIAIILMLIVPMFYQVNADSVTNGPAFTMSPNPVNGTYFFINFDFAETEFPNTLINITNVLGQSTYSSQIKHTDFANGKIRIDLAEAKMDKGVYFVQLQSGAYTKTLKLAVR